MEAASKTTRKNKQVVITAPMMFLPNLNGLETEGAVQNNLDKINEWRQCKGKKAFDSSEVDFDYDYLLQDQALAATHILNEKLRERFGEDIQIVDFDTKPCGSVTSTIKLTYSGMYELLDWVHKYFDLSDYKDWASYYTGRKGSMGDGFNFIYTSVMDENGIVITTLLEYILDYEGYINQEEIPGLIENEM